MFIVRLFLTFQHDTMKIGNHGMGIYDSVMDVGNNNVGIYCKLGLQVNSQQ